MLFRSVPQLLTVLKLETALSSNNRIQLNVHNQTNFVSSFRGVCPDLWV